MSKDFPKNCKICGYEFQIGDNLVTHTIHVHKEIAEFVTLNYILLQKDAQYIRDFIFQY